MKKVQTRFMSANQDTESIIFDLMADTYGMSETCNNDFDYSDALFSDGFVLAIEMDQMIPVLGSEIKVEDWDKRHGGREYHHAILNDECYVVFFKEAE